ncbi:MAG: hypothetical protein HY652_10015 [Acidobacteria bacterium]|nr:hypothetical protein [Acidobacteriota bacterium]
MPAYRYRRDLPDFPTLPTFKSVVRNWARTHGIPRKRGPYRSHRRAQIAYMREHEGRTFRQIAEEMEISPQAAHQLWKRHIQ